MGASSSSRSRKDQKLAPMGRSYGEVRENNKARLSRAGPCGKSWLQAVRRLRRRIWCSLGNSNPYFSLERATS